MPEVNTNNTIASELCRLSYHLQIARITTFKNIFKFKMISC